MKFVFVWLLLGVLFSAMNPESVSAQIYPVGQAGGWDLTFQDEFSGPSLNRNIWKTDRFNGGNGELQEYANDDANGNYLIQNGVLRIVAKKELYQGRQYSSGIIYSQGSFSQTYGYFEFKGRMPYGTGIWPAFWMMPDSNAWPPEIDVMEIPHARTRNYMTFHYGTRDNHLQSQGIYDGPDFAAAFHTFAVEWSPGLIVWYVDGLERFRTTNSVPNEPFHLLANLAVGGTWPGNPDTTTPFPAYFDIDYIRVWKKTTASPTATPQGKPGDANQDNRVDGQDYIVWLNNFGTTHSFGALRGDYNNSGRVDGQDYIVWLNNFGK